MSAPHAADQGTSARDVSFRTALFYAFGPASNWPGLAPFIAGAIDERPITAYWDDVLRLAASVRTGTVSASLMLKRVGAYPRQNGLAQLAQRRGSFDNFA